MADQKVITLRPGNATPKDIVLYPLPVADAAALTTIYLHAGAVVARDIVLRDPVAVPVSGGPVNITLAATEAADTFAASAQEGFRLAATEASDVASFSVQEGFRLAATEASDTAAFTADIATVGLALAATEGADSFAGALVEGQNITLAASEQPDVMAGTLAAGVIAPVAVAEAAAVPVASGGAKRGHERPWEQAWERPGGAHGFTAVYPGKTRAQEEQERQAESERQQIAALAVKSVPIVHTPLPMETIDYANDNDDDEALMAIITALAA